MSLYVHGLPTEFLLSGGSLSIACKLSVTDFKRDTVIFKANWYNGYSYHTSNNSSKRNVSHDMLHPILFPPLQLQQLFHALVSIGCNPFPILWICEA